MHPRAHINSAKYHIHRFSEKCATETKELSSRNLYKLESVIIRKMNKINNEIR